MLLTDKMSFTQKQQQIWGNSEAVLAGKSKQLEVYIWIKEERENWTYGLGKTGLKVTVEAVGWLRFPQEERVKHGSLGKAFPE